MHPTSSSSVQQNATWKSYRISFIIVGIGYCETVSNSFVLVFFLRAFLQISLSQNMVHHRGENMTDLWQKNKQTKKKPKSFLKILNWFFKTVKKAVFGLIGPCCDPWYWIYIAPNAFEDMGLVMLHVCLQIFQCFNCFSTFFSPILVI